MQSACGPWVIQPCLVKATSWHLGLALNSSLAHSSLREVCVPVGLFLHLWCSRFLGIKLASYPNAVSVPSSLLDELYRQVIHISYRGKGNLCSCGGGQQGWSVFSPLSSSGWEVGESNEMKTISLHHNHMSLMYPLIWMLHSGALILKSRSLPWKGSEGPGLLLPAHWVMLCNDQIPRDLSVHIWKMGENECSPHLWVISKSFFFNVWKIVRLLAFSLL